MIMWRKVFPLTILLLFCLLCCNGGHSTSKTSEELTRSFLTTTQMPTTNPNLTKTETATLIDPYTDFQIKSRERRREERLILIQAEILQRLGLQKQPNITSSVFTTEEQRRIIEHFQLSMTKPHQHSKFLSSHEEFYAKSFQSFYASCSVPRNSIKEEWEDRSVFRIYFDLNSSPSNRTTVTTAKLHLYKYGNGGIPPRTSRITKFISINRITAKEKHINKHQDDLLRLQDFFLSEPERLRVSLYQYLKAIRSKKKIKKKLIDSQMINANFEGWVLFDVKSPVKDWLQHSNKNFGLEVKVENSDGKSKNTPNIFTTMNCSDHEVPFPTFAIEDSSGFGDNESTILDNETYPRLDVTTIELPKSLSYRRQKRQTICSPIKESKGNCCAESLYISFEELGWDKWIIAPGGFHTSYCLGSCRLKKQTLLNSVLPKISPLLTHSWNGGCIPSKVHPLHIAYIDKHNQIKLSKLEDLIVSKCGCAA